MLLYAVVDESLIALGVRRDACGCPAAMAVGRKLLALAAAGELPQSLVGNTVAMFADRIEIGGKPHPIPAWLTDAIRAYDGSDYEPFPACAFTVDTRAEYVHPRHREPVPECALWGEVA